MSRKLSDHGFGMVIVLLVTVTLMAIVFSGWYILHTGHASVKVMPTSSMPKGNKLNKSTAPTKTVDPYVGWRKYCDNIYYYCFAYPADWKISTETTPRSFGDAGQTSISSPDGTVSVEYLNYYNRPGGNATFNATVIQSIISSANQSLSVIGGFGQLSSSYYPTFAVVDSSQLTDYPLTVGVNSIFPQPLIFTDQRANGGQSTGSFVSQPIKPMETNTAAQTWLNSSSAVISSKILESFSYQVH